MTTELSPETRRAVNAARQRQAAAAVPSLGRDDVEVTTVDGPVPIRLLRPRAPGPLPVCIWLPGGGWILDSSAVAEPALHVVAAATPCAVALVQYRLAPEHRFPVPLEDCVEAVRRLVERGSDLGLDTTRLAIGGTSAGANLAAALAVLCRDDPDIDLVAQILIYPPLLHGAMATGGDATLGRAEVDWYWSLYLGSPDQGRDPRASPLLEADLRGLPPALVIVTEDDPLREEGEQYAGRLDDVGVATELVCFAGVEHGFFSSVSVQADDARARVAETLSRCWRAPSGGRARAARRAPSGRPPSPHSGTCGSQGV